MSEPTPYKTAVVTGATSGIGRATVPKPARYSTTAVGCNTKSLADLADQCGAQTIEADVRDTQSIVDRLSGVEIDILVNNAGILST